MVLIKFHLSGTRVIKAVNHVTCHCATEEKKKTLRRMRRKDEEKVVYLSGSSIQADQRTEDCVHVVSLKSNAQGDAKVCLTISKNFY